MQDPSRNSKTWRSGCVSSAISPRSVGLGYSCKRFSLIEFNETVESVLNTSSSQKQKQITLNINKLLFDSSCTRFRGINQPSTFVQYPLANTTEGDSGTSAFNSKSWLT